MRWRLIGYNMEEYLRDIYETYSHIQDEQSKFIYINRLDYSLTHDTKYLENIVNHTVRNRDEWTGFCLYLKELQEDDGLVFFGAGIWGNILYSETNSFIDWRYAVDSNPLNKTVGDIRIMDFVDFARDYQGEYVVISSYKNYKGMESQLLDVGIPKGKIIDAGSVIYSLTEKAIYFDLGEPMPIHDNEVFVDAGCFDGLTTRQFFEWCGGKGYSYCFEPDGKNIVRINENLKGYGNYEIIGKALYSRNATLAINARGNFATSVSEAREGQGAPTIEAVALDDVLKGKMVTYIKMDIEGSELSALHGAEDIIREQKPKLAVSIYHKLEDIWTIPKLVLELNPEYRLYLRHYSFSYYDTVLYAV
jgi:FkbM family methyltransferase